MKKDDAADNYRITDGKRVEMKILQQENLQTSRVDQIQRERQPLHDAVDDDKKRAPNICL